MKKLETEADFLDIILPHVMAAENKLRRGLIIDADEDHWVLIDIVKQRLKQIKPEKP